MWWTGDGVSLEASVEAMVDSGVYDLKPYVHSDCGGDYRGKARRLSTRPYSLNTRPYS